MKNKYKFLILGFLALLFLYIFSFFISFILSLTLNKYFDNEENLSTSDLIYNEISKDKLSVLHNPFSPKFGNLNSKNKIVMFLDFDCEFCKEAYPDLRRIMLEYKDKVVFEFRNLPLTTIHPNSIVDANLFMCSVLNTDYFLEVMDLLYTENFSFLDFSQVEEYFVNLGFSTTEINDVKKCYKNSSYNNLIVKDVYNASDLNLSGTPVFFVNGYKFSGALTYENWKEILSILD
ncbi:DsbA family protein [Patescibacteria group bacterium]|nr:DsbA family protein [Patescibacteria group bacterium]